MILYWDFLVTFSLEVERYWGRQFTFSWVTLCFFGCRYLALLGNIPVLYAVAQSFNNDSVRGFVRASVPRLTFIVCRCVYSHPALVTLLC